MAIPALNAAGVLPPGLYDSAMAELRERFGAFRESDHRARLFTRLQELHETVKSSGLFDALVVDGSFVTAKPKPNDIDVIALLKVGHDFERDLPMSEYSLVSRVLMRRRYGFDVLVAENESPLYHTYLEFFSRVREIPDIRKGLVRLVL